MKKLKKMVLLATLIIGFSLCGKNIALGGELIDKNNWQKVQNIFPMTRVLEDVKDGLYTLNIVPATPMKVPKYFDDLTRKNAGQAKLTPSGHLPNSQYHGGIPFPNIDPKDPQAGKKIMWNFAWRYQGDDFFLDNERLAYDKSNRMVTLGASFAIMRAVGRGAIPPIPTIPGDEDLEIYWMTINTYPRDASGTVTLALRPNDPDKYDNMSRFFPSVRRVRRLPSTERYMAMPPTIFILDDSMGYSGKITHFTHKLVGEQKILVPAHVPPPPWRWTIKPGYSFGSGFNFELRDTWVVEEVPRPEIYPKYAYGKRIFYIDKESWCYDFIKIYDRKGEYWKEFNATFSETKTGAGEPVYVLHGTYGCYDLQTRHTGQSYPVSTTMIDFGLSREDFGIDRLLAISRMGTIRAR